MIINGMEVGTGRGGALSPSCRWTELGESSTYPTWETTHALLPSLCPGIWRLCLCGLQDYTIAKLFIIVYSLLELSCHEFVFWEGGRN